MHKINPNFPNYLIYDDGRVFSYLSNRYLKLKPGKNGYVQVGLRNNGKSTSIGLHRLLAFTFLGDPPETYYVVDHKDDNPSNNHISNLHWKTPSWNTQKHYNKFVKPFKPRTLFPPGKKTYPSCPCYARYSLRYPHLFR